MAFRTLVLHDHGDRAVEWLSRQAKRDPFGHDVVALSGEQLLDCRIAQSIGSATSVRIETEDGHIISACSHNRLINRMTFPSALVYQAYLPEDAIYAAAELGAVYCSLINAFEGDIVNPPKFGGVSASWRTANDWTALLSASGVIIRAQSSSMSDEWVYIFRGKVFGGDWANAWAELAAFSESCDVDFLGIHFSGFGDHLKADIITPCPPLEGAPSELARHLLGEMPG